MISQRVLIQLRNTQHISRLSLSSISKASSTAATNIATASTSTHTPVITSPTFSNCNINRQNSSRYLQHNTPITHYHYHHHYHLSQNNTQLFSTEASTKQDDSTTSSSNSNRTIEGMKNDNDDDTSTQFIPSQFTRERPPSILATHFPNEAHYTTGQAWSIISKHIAGGEQIRHSDFLSLCNSTKPQTPKEANLIARILKELKRCNRFILSKENADLSVDSMYRSSLPEGGVDDATGFYKVRCGSLIGQSFVNTNTGLYVSLETDTLEKKALEPLYGGLMDIQHMLNTRKNDDHGDEDGKNAMFREKTRELVMKAMNLSKEIFDTLVTRASTPTNNMKKRKKRKYLRYSKCSSGPTPSAIDLIVRICLVQVRHEKHFGDIEASGSGSDGDGDENNAANNDDEEKKANGIDIAKSILKDFEEKPFLGKALDETYTLIQEAEEMLLESSSEKEREVEVEDEEIGGEDAKDDEETDTDATK